MESQSCPHANFNLKETGDDDSQIIFIRKARVMGRRKEETRSGMTGLRGILKLLQQDSTSGVKKHSKNSLRCNYCIKILPKGTGPDAVHWLDIKITTGG
jgi:hypothetical protein